MDDAKTERIIRILQIVEDTLRPPAASEAKPEQAGGAL